MAKKKKKVNKNVIAGIRAEVLKAKQVIGDPTVTPRVKKKKKKKR